MRSRRGALLAIALVVLIAVLEAVPFYTDWLWFEEVGYEAVFLRVVALRGALFLAVGLFSFVFLWTNLRAAAYARPPDVFWELEEPLGLPSRLILEPLLRRALIPVTLVIALLFGLSATAEWQTLLTYRHAQAFGLADPIFQRDVGFYVFRLPLWRQALEWVFLLVGCTLLATALLYFLGRVLVLTARGPVITARARAQLLGLLALLLFAKAFDFYLDRFDLLYSQRGAVFGATYTDVHATLPGLWILTVLAALVGVAALLQILWRGARTVVAGLVVLAMGWMVGVWAVPAVVQRIRVAPNALVAESPFIAHHIRLTRQAFALDRIEERDFPARESLEPADLARNAATLKNVRLWDQGPLLATFAQLQEIRTYYRFVDVDNDRYRIDGEYRQLMLAARELSYQNLPRDPEGRDADRRWINEHLQYTHGYGAVVGPVNRSTPEGLPELFIRDIPPASSVSLKISRPEIYYGEIANDYVFVGTRSREIDYPAGDENVYTTYQGTGGVPVRSPWRRLLLAVRFGSYRVLLSDEITRESRAMYYRQVGERVRRIAPFLRFDADPYLVVRADGTLVWVIDAYTTTQRFPYAERVVGFGNYVRNSVKAVVDAYQGAVTFYLADRQDPIARAYAQAFPELFRPLDAMPPDLRAHIRYPAGLFAVQARMYATYHMQDPRVFYNKEDLWSIPRRQEGGREREMEPYYTIMRLPGEPREEFVLLTLFTPLRRDNMIAWLAARSDGEQYGRLFAFLFPKQRLVYGPRQIAARIDQDPVISQQLSLWNQRGSAVVRGSLLAIPIEESLIYIEPMYLAAEKGSIPELKRVFVAYGNQIAMEETLEASLQAIFERRPVAARGPAPETTARPPGGDALGMLVGRAWEAWTRAQESLRRGDWAGYGEAQKRLEDALRTLRERSGPPSR
ncbi:MAG: UPF0182 family protein [Candidatus Rokubacteria bacterium]|nr:UPF0182 family protein [Candidatus Rokubacteria bacterium]